MTAEPSGWSVSRRRVAYAVVRGPEPRVLIAEDADALTRVVAVRVVAASPAARVGSFATEIRNALLAERWSDAVAAWMEATGSVVDAYPDEPVWSEADLDRERTALEMRVAPLFEDAR